MTSRSDVAPQRRASRIREGAESCGVEGAPASRQTPTGTALTEGPRVVVFGNSGSGKSTYAAHLARRDGLAHLDLDTLVWEPGQVAVPRPTALVQQDLLRFLDAETRWVVEGCYSEWVEVASARCTEMVFLNPGETVCVAHCRARPWEPHKYSSLEEQNKLLEFLLDWARAYYTRDETCSLVQHQRLFRDFEGSKRELTTPVDFQFESERGST